VSHRVECNEDSRADGLRVPAKTHVSPLNAGIAVRGDKQLTLCTIDWLVGRYGSPEAQGRDPVRCVWSASGNPTRTRHHTRTRCRSRCGVKGVRRGRGARRSLPDALPRRCSAFNTCVYVCTTQSESSVQLNPRPSPMMCLAMTPPRPTQAQRPTAPSAHQNQNPEGVHEQVVLTGTISPFLDRYGIAPNARRQHPPRRGIGTQMQIQMQSPTSNIT
jgi:hypothetical protein